MIAGEVKRAVKQRNEERTRQKKLECERSMEIELYR